MENELDNNIRQTNVLCDAAQCLSDVSCEDVRVYSVNSIYDYLDFCIIATVRSEVHKRGAIDALAQFFSERSFENYARRCCIKTKTHKHEQGWLLIDLYDVVIHLMSEDIRQFYELEKLWFHAQCIFSSEHAHAS